jgi:hypothetical protein
MDARFHIETLEFINEKHGTIRPKEISVVHVVVNDAINVLMHIAIDS